jgi:Mg2+ and Co2+ transporter CorA
VFDWECTTITGQSDWEKNRVDGLVFASLLRESVLRMGVERVESEMRDIAYLADAEDGAGHFKKLTNFRHVLAPLHESMGETRNAFKRSANMELYEDGLFRVRRAKHPKQPGMTTPEVAMEGITESQWSTNFASLHTRSLRELQERLDDVKEDLNQEIQVAIGAVQVQDAQTMKEQTRVTVGLAVLAAIYLPLTLVTGIFGMNITEISDDETAPHVWSVVVAWVAVVALTAGGFLVWRSRKKEPDLEANEKTKNARSKAGKRAGKESGKGARRWARNVRQKIKTIRTSKRE